MVIMLCDINRLLTTDSNDTISENINILYHIKHKFVISHKQVYQLTVPLLF